ncbi:MAG TPA: gamma-glutamyl-gamma-aminobutyrate hydrolase family protein [Candidatus Limnocylindrales bacterium]|nr:gamma-glutamyl-gamma-aminobutyrate hydrolase family protein [Candidatus Limnocylindrales bacterium]
MSEPAGAKPKIAVTEPCSYDFEYSARAIPAYLHAIEDAGGDPVVIQLTYTPQEVARLITGCAAVVLTGSRADVDPAKFGAKPHGKNAPPDEPRETADELLLQDAFNLRKPVLAICYGLQSLNVWRSGTLLQHISTMVNHQPGPGYTHPVTIEPDSLLAHSINLSGRSTIPVNSSHHQSADRPGDGLRVVARCGDDGIIEALEGTSTDQYVLAVQWHPEKDYKTDQHSRRLFLTLVDQARKWQRQHPLAAYSHE